MARLVLGVATSHSPVLTLDSSDWLHRADADYANPALTLADGRTMTYAELVAERGELHEDQTTPEVFEQIAIRCQASLDRIAGDIAAARPDVVVIVGDDQDELYTAGNTPAIALFWGDEVVTHPWEGDAPQWVKTMAKGYGMDEIHRFPGHRAFAADLVRGLVAGGVDLAICNEVPDPQVAGFGHAFGFPVERLFRGRSIPIVPIMLNTYFPPNVISPSRCIDIGIALRQAIEASPLDLRVVVLASGGLSHFVVEEELDRRVIDNLGADGTEALRELNRDGLIEGTSEILNWVLTAGAVSHLPVRWTAYEPLRRTPAGTGIGLGFAVWGETTS